MFKFSLFFDIIYRVDIMDYKVTIDKFEGPLDLLLHLIKQSEVDIFSIKISDITNQYLLYISKMEDLNLNVDSEYLTMAADLIEMKSRELLPHEEEDEEEENPREELINRLVEYQKYKEISKTFKELEYERHEVFTKSPTLLNEFRNEGIKVGMDITLNDLIDAFLKFQQKKSFEKPLNTVVTKKEYSVHVRSKEILKKLSINKKMNFDELFDIYTKNYVVVTFLSILDLAKKGNIGIEQSHNLDKIVLVAKG